MLETSCYACYPANIRSSSASQSSSGTFALSESITRRCKAYFCRLLCRKQTPQQGLGQAPHVQPPSPEVQTLWTNTCALMPSTGSTSVQAGEQEADPIARARTTSSEGRGPARTSSPHQALPGSQRQRVPDRRCALRILRKVSGFISEIHISLPAPAGVLHGKDAGLLRTGSLMHTSA